MEIINYQPASVLSVKSRKQTVRKLILTLLAISLLFIRQTSDQPTARASQEPEQPPPTFDSLEGYLTIKDGAPKPPVSARSFVLLNPANAEVVVSQNADSVVPIASTTKMVTALVTRELYELDEVVEISPLAANINGADIQLVSGEKMTVHELLRGLMIQSGNDAAFALADHYSAKNNNYQEFVTKMNEYVAAVGLRNTVFGDPAGLDDEVGRSTAWDLAQIARLVLADTVLADIIATPRTIITSVDGTIVHQLTSSNRLLLDDSPYFLPGVIGIKTGFTPLAGHCLVSAYQSSSGLLIAVVLNTDEYSITASAAESRQLYSWAEDYLVHQSY